MASYPVTDIAGIGEARSKQLQDVGIRSVNQLLKAGATPVGRKELAEKVGAGMDERTILDLVNRADLFRIKGVSSIYSNLLEVAGVDTVKELAQRNPDNLRAKFQETNDETKLTKRIPTVVEITGWIDQAKTLPRGIEY